MEIDGTENPSGGGELTLQFVSDRVAVVADRVEEVEADVRAFRTFARVAVAAAVVWAAHRIASRLVEPFAE